MWSGAISFGLVNVPIKLYSAVSKKTVRFHQLNGETGSRIAQKRVDSVTGEEVPYENLVKGYELTKDRYVLITPDELETLEPEKSRTIDIEDFVDLSEIDPVYYDHPYYLVPDKGAAKAYGLLLNAMKESGRVAIARVILRSKEQLVAIRPGHEGTVLLMETMIFADEVVPTGDIDGLPEAEELQVSEREVAMAQQLIESLVTDFEPERYKDEYREKVLELIERKASGEEITAAPEAPAPAAVPDLMAALEASLAATPKRSVLEGDRAREDQRQRSRSVSEGVRSAHGPAKPAAALARPRGGDEVQPLGHARDLEHALNRRGAADEHEPALVLVQAARWRARPRAARSSRGSRAGAGRAPPRRRRARRRAARARAPAPRSRACPARRAARRPRAGRAARSRTRTSSPRKRKPGRDRGVSKRCPGCVAPTAPAPGSPGAPRVAASRTTTAKPASGSPSAR